jgi:hypothetical protein
LIGRKRQGIVEEFTIKTESRWLVNFRLKPSGSDFPEPPDFDNLSFMVTLLPVLYRIDGMRVIVRDCRQVA